MLPQHAASHYLQTQIQSRTPVELVVMLYDGAIRHADAAREAMAAGNIPARKAALSKLTAIIAELQNTLDMERGGEIAQDLDRLYTWAMHRLLDAVVGRDPRPIEEVRRVLDNLRGAWQAIAAKPVSAQP